MKLLKTLFVCLAVVFSVMFSQLNANAEIGVVNLDKIVSSYSKAQDVSADLKVKEAELQKFLADAQKQLKDAKSPVEKKNLEDKLTEEFRKKSDNFRDTQVKQWKQIEDNIYNTIESVSKKKKLTLVVNKAAVILGGIEITDEVLNILNAK